jgi:uncharacterized membrane protein
MTATFVPSHWPLTARSTRAFGRPFMLPGAGGVAGGVQWLFKRNCSITPRQLGAAYASLCGVSAVVGAFFFWQGAPFVAAFAGLELLAMGLAMLVFARHAADRETLTLIGRSLQVELWHGSRVERADLSADWLTVEPAAGQGSLVQLRGHGHTLQVGRHLRPELRGAFAQELRQALRQAPQFPGTDPETAPKTPSN